MLTRPARYAVLVLFAMALATGTLACGRAPSDRPPPATAGTVELSTATPAAAAPPTVGLPPTPTPLPTPAPAPTASRTPSPRPQPAAPPTPTAGATATPASPEARATDVTLRESTLIELVAGRELPADLALIVSGSGFAGLHRIHRAANGEVEERTLFDAVSSGGTSLITYWNIHHRGPALPPGQLAIAVCTTGDCGAHGHALTDDARTTIFRSWDGGVSWEESEELDGVVVIAAGNHLDALVVRQGSTDWWWPSGQVIEPPSAGTRGYGPESLGDDRIGWWTTGGTLVDALGRELLDLGAGLATGPLRRGIEVLPNADGTRLAVTWAENGSYYWSVHERSSDGRYERTHLLTLPDGQVAIPTAWLGRSVLLANLDLEFTVRLPVMVDIDAARATPLEIPAGSLGKGWTVAAQVGPFAEVDVGEGDCLNLRPAPSLDDDPLRCIPHAVLLELISPPDGSWVNVRAADGVTGWVSSEFVRETPTTGR